MKQFNILYIIIEIAVSTVVTAVLVSLISVLVSSSVVYLLMKRTTSTSSSRSCQENKGPDKAAVIYDLPNILTVDDVGEKAIQHNAAYGVL